MFLLLGLILLLFRTDYIKWKDCIKLDSCNATSSYVYLICMNNKRLLTKPCHIILKPVAQFSNTLHSHFCQNMLALAAVTKCCNAIPIQSSLLVMSDDYLSIVSLGQPWYCKLSVLSSVWYPYRFMTTIKSTYCDITPLYDPSSCLDYCVSLGVFDGHDAWWSYHTVLRNCC